MPIRVNVSSKFNTVVVSFFFLAINACSDYTFDYVRSLIDFHNIMEIEWKCRWKDIKMLPFPLEKIPPHFD